MTPWKPYDLDSVLEDEVAVTPQDVVYYMLRIFMDDAGAPRKEAKLKDSPGKLVSDTLISVIYCHNFEDIFERITGNVDVCELWLRQLYDAKKRTYYHDATKRGLADIDQHWGMIKDAIVMTQVRLSRYKLKCTRAPGTHELKWRGRGGVERGAQKADA